MGKIYMTVPDARMQEANVTISHGPLRLPGDLSVPAGAAGLVIFAHGSGSSRQSPRNRLVARTLQQRAIGTLLFDLLTEAEEREESFTGHLRFNILLLAGRLVAATDWVSNLAGEFLERVQAPTLLIVGGEDTTVLEMNRQAREKLRCENTLEIVPDATHLFEETGAIGRVAELAAEFLLKWLKN